MNRRQVLITGAAASIPVQSWGRERAGSELMLPLLRVFPFIDGYLFTPNESKNLIGLSYYVNPPGAKQSGVRLTAVTRHGDVPLDVSSDGLISWPAMQVFLDVPLIRVENPNNLEIGFSQRFLSRLPLGKTYSTADLRKCLDQATGVASRSRNKDKLPAPYNAVVFVSAKAGTIKPAGAAAGKLGVMQANGKDVGAIWTADRFPNDGTIDLATAPTALLLMYDGSLKEI
jgi:hypothetical protein